MDLRILGLKVLDDRSRTRCVLLYLGTANDSQFAPVSGVIADGRTSPDRSDIASTRNRTGEPRHVLDFIFLHLHPAAMSWQVAFHDEFVPEFRNLPAKVQDEIYAVGRLLEQFGPLLGRPQVDTFL